MDDDLSFEYGEETDANCGCGAILMGEMWYFGGAYNMRQVYLFKLFRFLIIIMVHYVKNDMEYLIYYIFKVSKIEGCKLVRQKNLDFDFQHGSCNSFIEPTSRILLCFSQNDPKVCHT